MHTESNDTLTETIIGLAYKVHNALGTGFLEKVYENALLFELKRNGLEAEQQKSIIVHYEDQIVGEYIVDILVNQRIIIELKAIESLSGIHEAQLINYLKATQTPLGLLINFGKRVEVKRRIFTKT